MKYKLKNLHDINTEFYWSGIKQFSGAYNIHLCSIFSVQKAMMVKWFMKTFKPKLFKTSSMNGNFKW